MAQAARMTDTGGMELLEREPSLALLADCAAEARRGDGRLVVLGGEAGVGKTALLERFQRELRHIDLDARGRRGNDPAARAGENTDQINHGTSGPIHCQVSRRRCDQGGPGTAEHRTDA
jgi:NADPH:quinone reductase-like Zn-dependent oxidoreductase